MWWQDECWGCDRCWFFFFKQKTAYEMRISDWSSDVCSSDLETGADDDIDEDDLERLKDMTSEAPAIRAVNRLITRAVELRASDIHIEPTEDALAVRFRIDGAMREMAPLPNAMKLPLVSRVKIMSGDRKSTRLNSSH